MSSHRTGSRPLVDVIIPIWNQPSLTRRCLESLFAGTPEPVRLILMDNGSSSETEIYLKEVAALAPVSVLLIRNETNEGFIRAVNQGIRKGTAPWVCLLNNDTVVTKGWLGEMLQVAKQDPTIGLVNPTSNSLGFHPGSLPLALYAKGLQGQAGRSSELSTALGFCLLLRRSLFDQIGLLDESYGMGNFDDDDLSRRVRALGMRCVRACASYVYHEEKASFRELPGWEKAFRENRKRFEARWGRKLRILWIPKEANGSRELFFPEELLLQLAREGHWLTLAAAPDAAGERLKRQAQVSLFCPRGKGWRVKVLARFLLKRKKPFDLAVSFDPISSRWISFLRIFTPAELLSNPTPEEVLEACQKLSRSPS